MILFISRKHPPSIGGMQLASYNLTNAIARRRSAAIIAWGRSQSFLPWFLLQTVLRVAVLRARGHIDFIHVGDAVLAPLGFVLGRILNVPVATTAHGLDITYPNPLYQLVIPFFLRRLDGVLAISRSTAAECVRRGVRSDRLQVVPYGAEPGPLAPLGRAEARERLREEFGIDLTNHEVLLTTGRLVPRKGVAWFVDAVLPLIVVKCPTVRYLVVGGGSERNRILDMAMRRGLADRVFLLGDVKRDVIWNAYRACDLFIMPNVPVSGDFEGLGLVALEAGAAERYVVASDLEGIRDAVIPGVNGVLVEPGDASRYEDVVVGLLGRGAQLDTLGRRARDLVTERFGWPSVAESYLAVFENISRTCAR